MRLAIINLLKFQSIDQIRIDWLVIGGEIEWYSILIDYHFVDISNLIEYILYSHARLKTGSTFVVSIWLYYIYVPICGLLQLYSFLWLYCINFLLLHVIVFYLYFYISLYYNYVHTGDYIKFIFLYMWLYHTYIPVCDYILLINSWMWLYYTYVPTGDYIKFKFLHVIIVYLYSYMWYYNNNIPRCDYIILYTHMWLYIIPIFPHEAIKFVFCKLVAMLPLIISPCSTDGLTEQMFAWEGIILRLPT